VKVIEVPAQTLFGLAVIDTAGVTGFEMFKYGE
jgi:hypothetical protein